MYATRGKKRRHLYRRLRGCYRILENERRHRDSFWQTLNEFCVPCVEVCRTLTPTVRLGHLKVLLLVPSLLFFTLLYSQSQLAADTRYQMMAVEDRPSWSDPNRLLGRLLRWQLLQRTRRNLHGGGGEGDRKEDVPPTPPRVMAPDCEALFRANPLEVRVTREMVYNDGRSSLSSYSGFNINSDAGNFSCEHLYSYWNRTDTRGFRHVGDGKMSSSAVQPVAYIIHVRNQQVLQLAELLRAIHVSQNTYCLYLPNSAIKGMRAATEQLAGCFQNALLAPPNVSQTDLDAQYWCMEKLLFSRKGPRWQHLIHTTDRHFPLATNRAMDRTFRRFPNASDVPAVMLGSIGELARSRMRTALKSALLLSEDLAFNISHPSALLLPQVPNELVDIVLYRGDYCFIAHRTFIQRVLNDVNSRSLRSWTKRTFKLPGLIFWPTQFARLASRHGFGPAVAASKQSLLDTEYTRRCVAEADPICVFTVDDLAWLGEREQLFAGRFDIDVDHVALHCLAQRRLKDKAIMSDFDKPSQRTSITSPSRDIPHDQNGASAYQRLNKRV